jgi:hypothetical protein
MNKAKTIKNAYHRRFANIRLLCFGEHQLCTSEHKNRMPHPVFMADNPHNKPCVRANQNNYKNTISSLYVCPELCERLYPSR